MKKHIALLSLFLFAACKGGATSPGANTELRLTRAPEGRIGIELLSGPSVVRAFQVEVSISGATSVTLEDPQPAAGLQVDTVRMRMHGADRAILFAGDKKGALLPSAGILATFVPKNMGAPAAGGMLSITKAVIVDPNGKKISTRLGPALTLY